MTETEIIEFLEYENMNIYEIKDILDELKNNEEYIEFLNGNYRKCKCCNGKFINNCFYKDRNECKTCYIDARKDYKGNRDKASNNEYQRKYYKKNRKKCTKRQRRRNARLFLERYYKKKFTHDEINKFVKIKYSKTFGYYRNKDVIEKLFDEKGELLNGK